MCDGWIEGEGRASYLFYLFYLFMYELSTEKGGKREVSERRKGEGEAPNTKLVHEAPI